MAASPRFACLRSQYVGSHSLELCDGWEQKLMQAHAEHEKVVASMPPDQQQPYTVTLPLEVLLEAAQRAAPAPSPRVAEASIDLQSELAAEMRDSFGVDAELAREAAAGLQQQVAHMLRVGDAPAARRVERLARRLARVHVLRQRGARLARGALSTTKILLLRSFSAHAGCMRAVTCHRARAIVMFVDGDAPSLRAAVGDFCQENELNHSSHRHSRR